MFEKGRFYIAKTNFKILYGAIREILFFT